MNEITSLLLRQMRRPLIALILAYTISILGMVLIPGQDDQGNVWHMSLFHAFYFVTYTATTIGFGEIPYPLSDAQRMWALFSVYISVVAWLYSIGKILTLVQDPAFRQASTESRFKRSVRKLSDPFYLVCGFGDTGGALLRDFSDRNIRSVVLDPDKDRINRVPLSDYSVEVPALAADARVPEVLVKAGLQHHQCAGVLALTSSDTANLKVAITAKLLNPSIPVICRSDNHDVNRNMASFGTDFIVDPFETFSDSLELALRCPALYILYDWLSGVPDTLAGEPPAAPRGIWVICGYGRFGKAVYKRLQEAGIEVRIIERDINRTGYPEVCTLVEGHGTEAETLLQAGITEADAIVAGTDDDSNNLSIIMTALELNPELFVVGRQNLRANRGLFEAVHADMVMQVGTVIARKVRLLLATPLVADFLQQVRDKDDAWANVTVSRIAAVIGDVLPHLWAVSIDEEEACAVTQVLGYGRKVTLADLLVDPRNPKEQLACIPLLLLRANGEVLTTPEEATVVDTDDRILFCGARNMEGRLQITLCNLDIFNYVMNGDTGPDGYLWRWLKWKRIQDRRSGQRSGGQSAQGLQS